MATKVPSCGDSELSITVVPPADRDAAAGSTAAGELQRAVVREQRTKSSAHDTVMWQLKRLNNIVFYIELLEYLGNAIGTVAFLWATVVMLGGFCSLLSRLDFWFATIMVFLEGTRVFVSKDTSVNQWLFGSTRSFRWDHFCFSDMNSSGNLIALIIGVGISLAPIEFGSKIMAGILKVAILAITSQLLARRRWGCFTKAVVSLFLLASVCGSCYGLYKLVPHKTGFFTLGGIIAFLKFLGICIGWFLATFAGALLTYGIVFCCLQICNKDSKRVFWPRVTVASGLLCLPLLQGRLGSKHRYLSISMAAALLTVNMTEVLWRKFQERKDTPKAPPEEQNNGSRSPDKAPPPEQEQSSNALLLDTCDLLLKIVDTITPILFFWGVMFPLPGISLKVSFYMLLSVIAAVLVGNLQIPVAFLQILLSSLRLHSLLAGHHSHHDYNPLPDGASPNLVPSIVVFFLLELCQGSSNILGVILGLISFRRRNLLVRVLGTKDEWVAKAVNLYCHQAFMTIKKNGLFPMENSTPPSFDTFAIESLGCTSSEMQIVRLHVLDYYLQQGDSKSKRKFISQIAKDAGGVVTKITGTISHLLTDLESSGNSTDTVQQIYSSLSLSLNFVWRLAVTGGKIGTRFRHELSGNPILLHSLQTILDLEVCPQELWKPTIHVIKLLALHDEATAKEIGRTHAVIPKLMGVFLVRGDVINLGDDQDGSLRKAAGEVLANLTITSSDNCRTILDMEAAAGRHDLINSLIDMLKDDNYMTVAANLLHNLCANSGDMLFDDLGAKDYLKSALQKVMQIIMGNGNDKQLDAALCVASQIGYVIPKEDFPHVLAESNLAPNTDTAAAELVGKLVDTLKSNREPNPVYPRLRRFLIGTVISLMELCPDCIEIFRTKGAQEALNKLKGTSSRLEKYKIFVGDEGMVPESIPMKEVVDKAKRLITV